MSNVGLLPSSQVDRMLNVVSVGSIIGAVLFARLLGQQLVNDRSGGNFRGSFIVGGYVLVTIAQLDWLLIGLDRMGVAILMILTYIVTIAGIITRAKPIRGRSSWGDQVSQQSKDERSDVSRG